MAIQFSDEHITIDTLGELIRFGEVFGGLQNISLEHAIQDEKKNVLIAAKRPLRENLILALENRQDLSKYTFVIEKSSNLRSFLASKISMEIEKKLMLADFSFAGWLMRRKNVDIFQTVRASLYNDFFFITLAKLFYEGQPILGHLMETALLSVGLYVDLEANARINDINVIFMAAMLHDYALFSDKNWEERDSFPSDGHDIESAALLQGKKIPEVIPKILRHSNKLTNRYEDLNQGDNKIKWTFTFEELAQNILLLCEYFSFLRRTLGGEETEQKVIDILFQLGHQSEHGAFPLAVSRAFAHHYEKYLSFFEYGQKIAQVEKACKWERFALAYPKPRATQVLCKDHHVACPLRQHTNRITIVQTENQVINRFGEKLLPGEYDKCQLSDKLPTPPEVL
ncbi:MAG: HD domain-containing protein [Leptospiraceae bacterium]|nr:HD domain-containing protein [Leptospiraceae bacterium]MDW8306318.1 HD domain-containing protein [Leptospiraceae bacterium]